VTSNLPDAISGPFLESLEPAYAASNQIVEDRQDVAV
jgi:hypothetical protein